jgi:hypothetical protein
LEDIGSKGETQGLFDGVVFVQRFTSSSLYSSKSVEIIVPIDTLNIKLPMLGFALPLGIFLPEGQNLATSRIQRILLAKQRILLAPT